MSLIAFSLVLAQKARSVGNPASDVLPENWKYLAIQKGRQRQEAGARAEA